MKVWFPLICLLFTVVTGCSSGKTVVTPVVDVSPSSGMISLGDIFTSSELIPLELTNASMLGKVDKVYLTENHIIAWSYGNRNDEVYFFSRSGDFSHKISRRGRGPQEYISIENVAWDPDARQILIVDLYLSKLLYFSLEAEFVGEITGFAENLFPRDIYVMPDGNLLLYRYDHSPMETSHGGLWTMDRQGNFLDWVEESDFAHPSISPRVPATLYPLTDGKIGFSSFEDPVEYSFDPATGELSPILTYNIKGKTVRDYKGKYTEDIRHDYDNRDFIFARMGSAVYEDRIFSWWFDNSLRVFYSFYDGNTGSFQAVYGLDWNIDEHFTILSRRHPLDNYEILEFMPTNLPGVMSTYITGERILEILEGEKINPSTRKRLEEITRGMDRDEIRMMNPVLQLLYMRGE